MEKVTNRGMRWKSDETKILLDCIIEKIKDNSIGFEKPVASAFYASLKQNNKILMQYNWTSMRDKMKNLKLKYKQATDWRNKTGQGIKETSGEQSVKSYIKKICPFFDELDEIFGCRANTNIEVVIDSESNYQDIFDGIEQDNIVLGDYVHDQPNYSDNPTEQPSVSLAPDEDRDQENIRSATEQPADAPEATAITEEASSSFITFRNQLEKNSKKRKFNSTNSTVAYLSKLHKERAELNNAKFEKEAKIEEEKLKLELRKIEFQEQMQLKQINMEEKKIKIEEKKIELEREKMQEEMKIKRKQLEDQKALEMFKLEKEMELKKYEIEMRVKYQKELY